MPTTNTDRYAGLRQLVDERRAIPLEVRLAALGAATGARSTSDPDVQRLRAPIEVTGRRTTVQR